MDKHLFQVVSLFELSSCFWDEFGTGRGYQGGRDGGCQGGYQGVSRAIQGQGFLKTGSLKGGLNWRGQSGAGESPRSSRAGSRGPRQPPCSRTLGTIFAPANRRACEKDRPPSGETAHIFLEFFVYLVTRPLPSAIIPLMCGRYRLSRRKEIVEEYFDSVSEEGSDPACPGHPPESEGARPRAVAGPLGAHSIMGKRFIWCCQDD